MHFSCLKVVLCSLGLWFHVKEQKEVWLKWIYHLISWVQPVHQHSGFVVSQSQAPALLWGKISYCMSGVGPSILCYVPKSPNGLTGNTSEISKGRALESEPRAAWIQTNQTSLSTSDKEKVLACVPRRWNETVQSGDSPGSGGTNSRMVDFSSRRIAKNLSLAKALTGNRAAKHIMCVTCGKLGERIWLY